MNEDFRQYYWLEQYLFTKVTTHYLQKGVLSARDLLMILIWKSNRAKTKHLERLRSISSDLDAVANRLASELVSKIESRDRLKLLMANPWRFRLPTATAILTVLYPNEFSVYDIRVCGQLEDEERFARLSNLQFSDLLWVEYQEYLLAVKSRAPAKLCLRDKDRFLWGKSFHESVTRDVDAFVTLSPR